MALPADLQLLQPAHGLDLPFAGNLLVYKCTRLQVYPFAGMLVDCWTPFQSLTYTLPMGPVPFLFFCFVFSSLPIIVFLLRYSRE